MLLQNGNYSVTLSFGNATNVNQTLDVDSIVLMWEYQGSKFYGAANQTMKNATKRCWENKQRVSLDSQDSFTCQKIAFSVNAELFNGSLGKRIVKLSVLDVILFVFFLLFIFMCK